MGERPRKSPCSSPTWAMGCSGALQHIEHKAHTRAGLSLWAPMAQSVSLQLFSGPRGGEAETVSMQRGQHGQWAAQVLSPAYRAHTRAGLEPLGTHKAVSQLAAVLRAPWRRGQDSLHAAGSTRRMGCSGALRRIEHKAPIRAGLCLWAATKQSVSLQLFPRACWGEVKTVSKQLGQHRQWAAHLQCGCNAPHMIQPEQPLERPAAHQACLLLGQMSG